MMVPGFCQVATSDTSCAPEDTQETMCCRVCLEEGTEKDLVAPCCCSGTSKWAHFVCIQKWINEKGNRRCEICRESYSGDYTNPQHLPVAGPQVPLLAPFRGIMLPSQFLIAPDSRAADSEETDEGDEGAQTSAAWCLSAVLLFMSLLLLRQAFEPPIGAREAAPGPSSEGAMQPHNIGSSLVYPTMPAEALKATPVSAMHDNGTMQDDGAPALAGIAVKLLMMVLSFCILLRIVAIVREGHLRHSQGAPADQSWSAALWNMEAGMLDPQHEGGQQQNAVQHSIHRTAQFLPFSVAVC